MAKFLTDGAVELYYDNSKKLATTSGGGTLTGTWDVTTAFTPDANDGATLGTTSLEWSDLYLADGAIIHFGNDQDVALIHNADKGLILKHTGTADDKPVSLTLQTGETDIAANDVIGAINFQAPDEGTGTDAILVAAGIEAVSEGDFSSSNNATKLSFKTGASEAATQKMSLSSGGNLDVAGNITQTTDSGELNVLSTGTDQWDSARIRLEGPASANRSTMIIHGNTATDSGDSTRFAIELANASESWVQTMAQYDYTSRFWAFTTGAGAGSERMRIDTNGRIAISHTSPDSESLIDMGAGENSGFTRKVTVVNTGNSRAGLGAASNEFRVFYADDQDVRFKTISRDGNFTASEKMVLNRDGKLGIGRSSPTAKLDVYSTATADLDIARFEAAVGSYTGSSVIGANTLGKASTYYLFTGIVDSDGDGGGPFTVFRVDGNGQAVFGSTDSSPYDNTGNNPGSVINMSGIGLAAFARSGGDPLAVNRTTNDGDVVVIYQGGTAEGSISVSGSTVSYNGGHISRWSQLSDNSKDNSILKGTVMTNLDEMCVWKQVLVTIDGQRADDPTTQKKIAYFGEKVAGQTTSVTVDGKQYEGTIENDDNEQRNRMAVSSVEGDPNVAGVFVNWASELGYENDCNVAMTGDMVIRIPNGVSVARGDLLMSAGNGCAKPQGDDIVRSKTIAKITSTNITKTYADGSYLVPCVLMAC
jgi:hypothetical protein